jgi:chaperone LolA
MTDDGRRLREARVTCVVLRTIILPAVFRAINTSPGGFRRASDDVSGSRLKSWISLMIGAILAVLAAGSPDAVSGQSVAVPQAPPDPLEIVSEIHARYDATRSLRARFEQRYTHRLHQHEERWRGRLSIRRPSKIRIDYERPRGRVVVSDGTTLIAFDPDPEPGIWWEQTVDQDSLPLVLGLLAGTSRVDAEHDVRVIDAASSGFVGSVIELRPRVPMPLVDRVLLYVDRGEAARGRIHRAMIVDPAGNTNRFDLRDHDERGSALAESLFTWRPPAVARRVEP